MGSHRYSQVMMRHGRTKVHEGETGRKPAASCLKEIEGLAVGYQCIYIMQ